MIPTRKTIAEREGDYRAQWRKRKLSPPKDDPFTLFLKKKPQEPDAKRAKLAEPAVSNTKFFCVNSLGK